MEGSRQGVNVYGTPRADQRKSGVQTGGRTLPASVPRVKELIE